MSDLYRQIARLNALLRRGALSDAQWYQGLARLLEAYREVRDARR